MDKAKKKQIKKITSWVLMAAVVVLLAAMPLLAKAEAEADGPVATVYSGTVEPGSVHTALHGGGTLVTEGIEDVNLPSGVKIKEFLVNNGDFVTAGTPLAAVDTVSVMTAITSVAETMEYLQDEMADAKNEKVSSTISATAGGRIKKVYAKPGDSVQDVMLRDGALALLSLDGLMAVKIEKKMDLPTGETVTVTLDEGRFVIGRVESNLDGEIVITIDDKGYEIGKTVTVTAKDGTEVGTGDLYVHNAWIASAYSGTIKTVSAKEETKVSAGATLFTLTDTDFRGKLTYLGALHREYEELTQDLFKMYNSGTIDAPCDGTVSGIDKDSAHLLAANVEAPEKAALLTAEEPGWTLMLLSETVYEAGACGSDTCPLEGNHTVEDCPRNVCDQTINCPANPDRHDSSCIFSCDRADSPNQCDGTGDHYKDCIKSCISAKDGETCPSEKHYPTCVETCRPSDGSTLCPSVGNHRKSCIQSCTNASEPGQCPGTLHHYPDCISLCINSDSGSKTCPATKHVGTCFFAEMEYKGKVALVSQVGTNELIVKWDSSNQEYDIVKVGGGWKFETDQGFNLDLLVKAGKLSVSNPKSYKPGDVIFVVTGYKGNTPVWSGIPVFMHISSTPNVDLSGVMDGLQAIEDLMNFQMPDLSALLKGFGNFGFYAPSPVEEDKLFDLEGSTLMTVSPQETVSLTISLDEQDIAKVAVGQQATVKVEALGEEIFPAEVKEVSRIGANTGGSSKFTARLELNKQENMLDGMSATASLPLLQTQQVPTIPVMALAEQGAKTVVYTALDEEGNPSQPVVVTIGLSDGNTAEILSGLEVGDPYYYSYYDVLELDTGVEERFTLS